MFSRPEKPFFSSIASTFLTSYEHSKILQPSSKDQSVLTQTSCRYVEIVGKHGQQPRVLTMTRTTSAEYTHINGTFFVREKDAVHSILCEALSNSPHGVLFIDFSKTPDSIVGTYFSQEGVLQRLEIDFQVPEDKAVGVLLTQLRDTPHFIWDIRQQTLRVYDNAAEENILYECTIDLDELCPEVEYELFSVLTHDLYTREGFTCFLKFTSERMQFTLFRPDGAKKTIRLPLQLPNLSRKDLKSGNPEVFFSLETHLFDTQYFFGQTEAWTHNETTPS